MIQQYEAVSLSQKTMSNNALKLILKVVKKGTTESKEVFEKAFVCGMYKEKEVLASRSPRKVSEGLMEQYKRMKYTEELVQKMEGQMDDYLTEVRGRILSGLITKKDAIEYILLKKAYNKKQVEFASLSYDCTVSERTKILKREGRL